MCIIAIQALYGVNDACSNAVRQFVANSSNTDALFAIFSIPGCEDRFNGLTSCNFDTVSNDTDSNNGSTTTRPRVSDESLYYN